MSRTSISTGNFSLDAAVDKKAFSASRKSRGVENSSHCHIVFLADFSGRGHRGLSDASTIYSRKIIEIDRDNFDDVFQQMDVRCALPIAEELRFSELDEMHPDYLYEQVDLFHKFKVLKKKLKSPSTFESAAQEVFAWHNTEQKPASDQGAKPTTGNAPQGSLLDSILTGDATSKHSGQMDVQALVKDIVAPYVSPKPDPQQKELIHSVDQAASELMRKIMHHPQFQTIESAWRSLYLLVRRIETSSKLKLFIVDISHQELIEDALSAEAAEASQLNKLLVDSRSALGGKAFNIIMADEIFGIEQRGIQALNLLGKIADSANALFISGASTELAGCESLGTTPDREDWNFLPDEPVQDAWRALRASPHADRMISVAPRFLSRMPYGRKSSPIDSFHFEELPDGNKHAYYLWSNGAWLVALLLAQGFSVNGSITRKSTQEVERLPLHVFYEDGESKVTPCAEVNLFDSAAQALEQQGFTVVRSILNKDSVLVPQIQTLATRS
ncbi:MAG: type VI secretion system contractile sheath domain-containing protein [Oleiphilus sp.]